MGVKDKDARAIRVQTALARASEDNGGLMSVGEYSVHKSGRWRAVTVPKLVMDNCDVSAGDSTEMYCDFDAGMLVIDFNGGER